MTWIGDIQYRTSPPKVRACHVRRLLELVQPGDVVCRKYCWYLDAYLIPGKYSHSGVVVSDHRMVHSVSEGVTFIDPMDFIKDTDGFVLIRPSADAEMVTAAAMDMVGKPYDFMFDLLDKDAMYCHEMTLAALEAGGMKISLSHPGRVIADDLIACCKVVYEI